MFTTNPKYQPLKRNSFEESMGDLNDIEYPSLGEIKMKKDPSKPKVVGRGPPRIDRSSKAAAEQKFSKMNSVENIKVKENIVDQILEKGQEVLEMKNELISAFDASDANEDPLQYKKRVELEYKLMQKENELNDTVTELETQAIDPDEYDDTKNEPEYKEAVARLQAKEMQHSKMAKISQENAQVLETKRRAATEHHKRHLQVILILVIITS